MSTSQPTTMSTPQPTTMSTPQPTTMSTPQPTTPEHHTSRLIDLVSRPLKPPLTDNKPVTETSRVIAHFRQRYAGRDTGHGPWTTFKLAPEEFNQLERAVQRDSVLWGYVDDKIRYDYDGNRSTLVIRMPTTTHERFLHSVENGITVQLKAICNGSSDTKAQFARKVQPARSTIIEYAPSTASMGSRHEPDASFWHDNALYPGVVMEVAFSQKRKDLRRLAHNHLLGSQSNVQVFIGLDIEYGKNRTREATLSVWRMRHEHIAGKSKWEVVQVVADEPFRTTTGEPANQPGLRLQLSDFACKKLTKDIIDDDGQDIVVSTQELCNYLDAAEAAAASSTTLEQDGFDPEDEIVWLSESSPEEMSLSDEARYVELEERAAQRAEEGSDYED